MRLKLTIAYDGGPFLGWQSQTCGNTIQDHLEAAFQKICNRRIIVHGAGRTDAGVHASAQCAHADAEHPRFSAHDWIPALNANLPPEIRVLQCTRVAAGFHARFSATGKIYTYRIWNDPILSPFEIGRAWHLPGRIDIAPLKTCATLLAGTHDFAAFAANRGKPVEDTVRTVHKITVAQKGPLITLAFHGNGFLYKMVRLMTGTMIRCAQGRANGQWMQDLLEGKTKTSFAAPACGLYLTRVIYTKPAQ